MRKKIKKRMCGNFFSIINVLALSLAVLSVNSTCVWVHHQPRVPEGLQRKRGNL